jgi:hypothetical protein
VAFRLNDFLKEPLKLLAATPEEAQNAYRQSAGITDFGVGLLLRKIDRFDTISISIPKGTPSRYKGDCACRRPISCGYKPFCVKEWSKPHGRNLPRIVVSSFLEKADSYCGIGKGTMGRWGVKALPPQLFSIQKRSWFGIFLTPLMSFC